MPSEFLIQEFLLQGDGFCNVWSERSFCGTALWQWCRAICVHAHAPACMSIRSPCLNSLGESCGGRHEQKVLWLRIFRSKNILIKEVFLWLKVHIVWLLLMHMRLQPPPIDLFGQVVIRSYMYGVRRGCVGFAKYGIGSTSSGDTGETSEEENSKYILRFQLSFSIHVVGIWTFGVIMFKCYKVGLNFKQCDTNPVCKVACYANANNWIQVHLKVRNSHTNTASSALQQWRLPNLISCSKGL